MRTASPLDALYQEIRACTRCRKEGLLHKQESTWAYPILTRNPNANARVLVVMEAPNKSDTYDLDKGYLTVNSETDESGKLMYKLLDSVGLDPDTDVIFTNSVLCLPKWKAGKYPVTSAQTNLCGDWLQKTIDAVNPKVVMAFGVKALTALGKLAPHGYTLKKDAGTVVPWNGRALLPLYHTSMLARKERSVAQQMQDIQAAVPFLGDNPPPLHCKDAGELPLAWYLADEICKRFYQSAGVVPLPIWHEGLGFYGIQFQSLCAENPRALGRTTILGDVENWRSGGPGDHGCELAALETQGVSRAELLKKAIEHLDLQALVHDHQRSSSPPPFYPVLFSLIAKLAQQYPDLQLEGVLEEGQPTGVTLSLHSAVTLDLAGKRVPVDPGEAGLGDRYLVGAMESELLATLTGLLIP